jgi:hypothetical protein
MEQKRIMGLFVFSSILILMGMYIFLNSFSSLNDVPEIHNNYGLGCVDYYDFVKYLITCLEGFIYSIFMIWVGVGVFRRKGWARTLTLYTLPIILFFMEVHFCDMGGVRAVCYSLNESIRIVLARKMILMFSSCALTRGLLEALLIYLPFFVYFTRPKVKEQFK